MFENFSSFGLNQPEYMSNANYSAAENTNYVPKKHIKGIVCDVQNCGYNDGRGGCTAEKIAVGPSSATACTDTVCATFKPRGTSVSS